MRSRSSRSTGLMQGKHLPVDGSFVEANAAKENRRKRDWSQLSRYVPPWGSVSGAD